MVVPSWKLVFYVSRPPWGYLTWWSRAGTMCFHVSTTPRWVSNMVVPRWNHVFSRVQANQWVSNLVVPNWNHVFSPVHDAQVGI